MKKEISAAKKYVYVRKCFCKTKILCVLFTMICSIMIALEMVDLVSFGFADTSTLGERERILLFFLCIALIALGIYFLISRIIWISKYSAKNKELEALIRSDENLQKFVKKTLSGNVLKRMGRSTSAVQSIIEGISCFFGILVVYLGLIVYFGARMFMLKLGIIQPKNDAEAIFLELVGGVASTTENQWKAVYEFDVNHKIYIGQDDYLYTEKGDKTSVYLIGYEIFNIDNQKIGEIIGKTLSMVESEYQQFRV